jgi:hypothetical protein
MTIDAMKQALEALTRIWEDGLENFPESGHDAAITALRTAIEAAEKQEPRHIVQSNGRHSPLLTHMMNSRTTPPAAQRLEAVNAQLLEALESLAAADFGAGEWTESAEQAALKARAAIAVAKGEA